MGVSSQGPASLRRHGFIVNYSYDAIFFIFAPLLALCLGAIIDLTELSSAMMSLRIYDLSGASTQEDEAVVTFMLGTIIHAHLVAVFYRSHLRQSVFQRYRWRMTLVPLLVLVGMLTSIHIAVVASLIITWWDVYHSGAQTLGFGRIYDRIGGCQLPRWARFLDAVMNQVIYAGPILAGVNFMDHLGDLEEASELGWEFVAAIPAQSLDSSWLPQMVVGVTAFCSVFMIIYLLAQILLFRMGYRVSPQKTLIYLVTAAVSIYTWGFYSFGNSFFIMNVFHAVQYFAIIWATEKQNLVRLSPFKQAGWPVLLFFLLPPLLYGSLETIVSHPVFTTLFNVVALLHFWYDGFIWKSKALEHHQAV